MRVLVCGSRTWTDGWSVRVALHGIEATHGVDAVIHGAAQGADSYAAGWASQRTEEIPFRADWKTHGKAAGPIRNQQMLDEGKPDVVWAFVDKPLAESRGTADMVRRARAAGLPVYVVERPAPVPAQEEEQR